MDIKEAQIKRKILRIDQKNTQAHQRPEREYKPKIIKRFCLNIKQ